MGFPQLLGQVSLDYRAGCDGTSLQVQDNQNFAFNENGGLMAIAQRGITSVSMFQISTKGFGNEGDMATVMVTPGKKVKKNVAAIKLPG